MNNRVQQREVSNSKLLTAARNAVNAGSSNTNGLAGCVAGTDGKSAKQTQDGILYIVGEVTAGGKIELFKLLSEQKERVGLTNFAGNQLGAGSNAVIDAISIDYASTTNTSGHGDIKGLDFSEEADPAVKNSHFTFTADGKTLIDIPTWEAHNPNTTRTNDEKYRGLGHLPIIESQVPCEAEFEFPTNVTPDGTDGKRHYVRVALRRNQTVSR